MHWTAWHWPSKQAQHHHDGFLAPLLFTFFLPLVRRWHLCISHTNAHARPLATVPSESRVAWLLTRRSVASVKLPLRRRQKKRACRSGYQLLSVRLFLEFEQRDSTWFLPHAGVQVRGWFLISAWRSVRHGKIVEQEIIATVVHADVPQ